jgi:ribosomal protein L6P/L9E
MFKSFLYTNILGIRLQGVGYKLFIKKKIIVLEIGLTHRIFISIPKGLFFVSPEASKNQSLFITGFCKIVVLRIETIFLF